MSTRKRETLLEYTERAMEATDLGKTDPADRVPTEAPADEQAAHHRQHPVDDGPADDQGEPHPDRGRGPDRLPGRAAKRATDPLVPDHVATAASKSTTKSPPSNSANEWRNSSATRSRCATATPARGKPASPLTTGTTSSNNARRPSVLVVRVELYSANDGSITELARCHICNVTSDALKSDTFGDYKCDTLKGRSKRAARSSRETAHGLRPALPAQERSCLALGRPRARLLRLRRTRSRANYRGRTPSEESVPGLRHRRRSKHHVLRARVGHL
jgi:hypothetical protein